MAKITTEIYSMHKKEKNTPLIKQYTTSQQQDEKKKQLDPGENILEGVCPPFLFHFFLFELFFLRSEPSVVAASELSQCADLHMSKQAGRRCDLQLFEG